MVTFEEKCLSTDVVSKSRRLLCMHVLITTACIHVIPPDMSQANIPLSVSKSCIFWLDRAYAVWGRGHVSLVSIIDCCITLGLQCFDAVGWVAGRASGL